MGKPQAVVTEGLVAGRIVPAKPGRLRGGNGGRNLQRMLGLLEAILEAADRLYFQLRALAHLAEEAEREPELLLVVAHKARELGHGLDESYRALYALREYDETASGQLVLPMVIDDRPRPQAA